MGTGVDNMNIKNVSDMYITVFVAEYQLSIENAMSIYILIR